MRNLHFIIISAFFISLFSFANDTEFKSVNFGHSLSPSSHIPKQGTITVGSVLGGYSFSDSIFVGTSTWMAWGYNSYSVIGKYQNHLENTWLNSVAVQIMYLKSGNFKLIAGNPYDMETISTWLVFAKNFTDQYTLNLDLNYMHFFNERTPHSLRREPFNNDPWQVSLSTLHEVLIYKNNGLNFEFGILGLNYKLPWLQTGFSYFHKMDNWHLQLGLSNSSVINANSPLLDNGTNSSKTVIHPEVHLQYFW